MTDRKPSTCGLRVRVSLAALVLVSTAALIPPPRFLGPLLANLLLGARHFALLSVATVCISTTLGALLGAVAAFRGSVWDSVASRFLEAASTFPAIALLAIFRAIDTTHPMRSTIAALVVIRTPAVARVVRSHLFILLRSDYIVAARAIGAPPHQMFRRHALPILAPPVLQAALSSCAIAIGLDTALAVIGFASQNAGNSWGTWVGRSLADQKLAEAFPAALLSIAVLTALLTLADFLHDKQAVFRGNCPLRDKRS